MEDPDNKEAVRKLEDDKSERRRKSKAEECTRDEIKIFKENLLQTVASGATGDSITADSGLEMSIPSRSRSASRAREALVVPPNFVAELDKSKLFELKEAFLLFDLNGDGYIDFNDLRGTLISLGEQVQDQAVRRMFAEAPHPLDFDAFVRFLGYRTLELDSEDTLVDALSRWDLDKSGYISEAKIRHDLMTWGDRFTEKEVDYALNDAPTVQRGGQTMIDYVQFCSQLCGLKKADNKTSYR